MECFPCFNWFSSTDASRTTDTTPLNSQPKGDVNEFFTVVSKVCHGTKPMPQQKSQQMVQNIKLQSGNLREFSIRGFKQSDLSVKLHIFQFEAEQVGNNICIYLRDEEKGRIFQGTVNNLSFDDFQRI